MNFWTSLSIEYANQRNYLDMLFLKVYPMSPNIRRVIDKEKNGILLKLFFNNQNNEQLINALFALELFPIKDSYVAYLKRDRKAITRNPETVNRLAGSLYEMGIEKIYEKCTEPKETNRQIGPLFKRWISSGTLGAPIFLIILKISLLITVMLYLTHQMLKWNALQEIIWDIIIIKD